MTDFRDLQIQEKQLMNGIEEFDTKAKVSILDALEWAKKAHEGQQRDEGDSYIIHPIRVANTLLYDLNVNDVEMIIAGLLHDVVEDTGVSINEVGQKFGERIAQLVMALTRNKSHETKKEKFERIVAGPEDVRLIKACDWLDNLRSLNYRSDRGERWRRHLQEAEKIYIPLAKAAKNEWLINEMEKAYDEVLRLR